MPEDEDEDVWRAQLSDVTPGQYKARVLQPLATKTRSRPRTDHVSESFMPPFDRAQSLMSLVAGQSHGINAATARRLKRGTYPLDAVIDLHGLHQQAAFDALEQAIHTAAASRHRCVLVITGKGHRGEGVIRQQLPRWLNDERIRPYLLAFEQAQPQDGGKGAFYVLLRKAGTRAGNRHE